MKLNDAHHHQMNQIQFWTGIKIITKPPLDIKLVPKVHNCDFQTFKCLCGLKTCPKCCKTWLAFYFFLFYCMVMWPSPFDGLS
jgi:hypothetical protein